MKKKGLTEPFFHGRTLLRFLRRHGLHAGAHDRCLSGALQKLYCTKPRVAGCYYGDLDAVMERDATWGGVSTRAARRITLASWPIERILDVLEPRFDLQAHGEGEESGRCRYAFSFPSTRIELRLNMATK